MFSVPMQISHRRTTNPSKRRSNRVDFHLFYAIRQMIVTQIVGPKKTERNCFL